MRSLGALGLVAMLVGVALLRPWSLLPAENGDVVTTETRARGAVASRASASAELAEARRCLVRLRARPRRICERRGGTETRLGMVREPSRR
jgi:hypothetical protein